MRIKFFIVVLFMFLFAPVSAKAQERLEYIDPLTVGRIIQSLGLPYQTKFDDSNRPRLIVTDRNLRSEQFEIYFFDCAQGTKCESITLWSWYNPTVPLNYFRPNSWNKQNRFIKSYLDDDFLPVMEMDINARGGIDRRNLEILIRAYVMSMDKFGDFMRAVKREPANRR